MRLKWLSLVHQQGDEKMFDSLVSMKMAVSINAVGHTTDVWLGDLGGYRCSMKTGHSSRSVGFS